MTRKHKSKTLLKKLLSRKMVAEIVQLFLDSSTAPASIIDKNGEILMGREDPESTRTTIIIDQQVCGWVSSPDENPLLARLITVLLEKESEMKSLIQDSLLKYREIALLYDIAGKIVSCLDMEDVARLVVKVTQRAIKADNVSLMLLNHDTGTLDIVEAAGNDVYPKTCLTVGKGIAGSIAASGKAEIINDVHNDPRFIPGANRLKSLICVPLKVNERIIGIINISNNGSYAYTSEDLKLARTLASQTALSLENARHIAELRQSEKEYRTLYEKYHSLYENAIEGIFQSAPDGTMVNVNPAFKNMTGYEFPQDELLKFNDFLPRLFAHEEDMIQFRMLLEKNSQAIGFEAEMCRKDGTGIWGSISARMVHDAAHGASFIEGSLVDITERIEKEKARREREAADIKTKFIREMFGRYLSDEIVHNILETPNGLHLGGIKRVATIMMSDLRGFTAISERLHAEEVVEILNNYLEIMTEIIFKFKGTIDEFIGDAILVIFGAPVQHGNDPMRAVACAVEMQLAMGEVNRRNRERGYPELEMGIGINTGPIVAGNVGSKKRVKYGVIGTTVNHASRIESYTVGGQILASESTVKACENNLRIDNRISVSPKGFREKITIYEVGGIGAEYNLFLPEKETVTLDAVRNPIPVRFTILSGKGMGDTMHRGFLIAVKDKFAEIQAEVPVKKLANLKVSLYDHNDDVIASNLYSKVITEISASPPVFRMCFTFIIPEVQKFLNEASRI